MPRTWRWAPGIAALLMTGAVVAGCASSGAGAHPRLDPDVGTATATSPPTGTSTGTSKPAADRCPPTFGQVQSANGPVAPRIGAPGTLGVSPDPRSALVCFFGPLTSHTPPTLLWSRSLDRFQATALLGVVDARPQHETDRIGPINCPLDNGSAAILRFSYAASPVQEVLVRMTGCRVASSEHGTTMFREDIARAVLNLQAPVVQN